MSGIEKTFQTLALPIRFSMEIINWIAAGRPIRDTETIKLLFDTFCVQCPEFVRKQNDSGYCNKCGCNINLEPTMFNKLGMGTTSCPLDPPRWRTGIEISPESIQGRQEELFHEYLQMQQEQQKSQSGQNCCGQQQTIQQ